MFTFRVREGDSRSIVPARITIGSIGRLASTAASTVSWITEIVVTPSRCCRITRSCLKLTRWSSRSFRTTKALRRTHAAVC
jgi:hypothetical protein